jgi:hypothetical protein
LPGVSNSDIKNAGKPFSNPTPKMLLGTAVHNYLLEPEKYNHENIEIVKPVAVAIKKKLGNLWQYLEPEVCITCLMVANGMALQYRMRADLHIMNQIVIDIKISKVPLSVSVKRFGYDDQLTGYCLGTGAKVGMIVRGNPDKPQDEPEVYIVKQNPAFWENEILKRGTPFKP